MSLMTSQYPKTGVTVADVKTILFMDDSAFTCKEIGRLLNIDVTVERNLKAISNQCGYLVAQGHAVRVGPGTYQQRGSAMTMTDIERPSLTAVPTASSPTGSTIGIPPEGAHFDSDGKLHCDLCDKPVASKMGLMNHMTRSHGAPGGKLTADQAFERTGQALEVLFPDGIPMSRLIELADLQKAMLRAIK